MFPLPLGRMRAYCVGSMQLSSTAYIQQTNTQCQSLLTLLLLCFCFRKQNATISACKFRARQACHPLLWLQWLDSHYSGEGHQYRICQGWYSKFITMHVNESIISTYYITKKRLWASYEHVLILSTSKDAFNHSSVPDTFLAEHEKNRASKEVSFWVK